MRHRTNGCCTGPGCETSLYDDRIVNIPRVVPSLRHWAWLWTAGIAFALAFTMKGWGYDDLYITYRYSLNIAQGAGFVFNPGEYVLSTTTPLYALVLAFFRVAGGDLPTVSLLIGAVSLALGGLALWHLGQRWHSPTAAWTGLLVYPFFPLLATTLGSEQPFTLALVLWGVVAYAGRRYPAAAVLLALAVISRADSGLMALILAIHYLFWRRRAGEEPFPWSALAMGGAILLLWVGFAWSYFGSPLPVTLAAKRAQGVMAISQSYWTGLGLLAKQYWSMPGFPLILGCAGVGLLFLPQRSQRSQWLLIVAWSGAHLLAYTALGVTRYFWYYAQIVPGLAVLTALGVDGMAGLVGKRAGRMAALVLTILLAASMMGIELSAIQRMAQHPDARLIVYREVGEWLAHNTPADATVGTLEVGIIGYYAQRSMIDFAGLLQPETVVAFTPTATYDDTALWAIQRYLPDYLVLRAGTLPRVEADPRVTAECTWVHTVQRDDFPAPMLILHCRWG